MRKGQTLLEYMILLGIAVMVIFYMGPAFKRGLQSLIKVTADQIGNQEEADQEVKRGVDDQGRVIISEDSEGDAYLVKSNSSAITTGNKLVSDGLDDVYTSTVYVNEETTSQTQSVTDMGFTKD